MKKLLTSVGAALAAVVLAGVLVAQEYYNRPPYPGEARKIAGATSFVQDELLRDTTPVFVENSLSYEATNYYDGVILIRTNATVIVRIGMPNPTNNTSRKFRITTMGASTAVLTNTGYTGSFTEMFTIATASTYTIASNKTAVAYSTGTNWYVRVH